MLDELASAAHTWAFGAGAVRAARPPIASVTLIVSTRAGAEEPRWVVIARAGLLGAVIYRDDHLGMRPVPEQ